MTARILHCHSTFSLGGKEARAVRLMNAFGDAAEHVVISAEPTALGARDALDPGIVAHFPADAPSLRGRPGIPRYRALARYMRGADLVLTYNWGAIDAVAARALFGRFGPPLVHHEDGFNADEADRLNWKRNRFRRLVLRAARKVVVPSPRLGQIAGKHWGRLVGERIPNGIDTARYAAPPAVTAIPGFSRQADEIVIGTVAGLREVKNLPRLVRAVAAIPKARLVIVGEGTERARIMAEAAAQGMADRLLMPGFLPDPHRYIGLFDIFALSSDSEQFPISLIEAMAAGLPVVATDVGDVAQMVAGANRFLVVPPADEALFGEKLALLAADPAARATLGKLNQARAVAEYDEATMIERYRRLYFGPDPA